MDNLFNSLALTIIMTAVVVLVLIGLFFGLLHFTKRKSHKIKKSLLVLLYIVFFFLLVVGVYFIGWFYKAQFVYDTIDNLVIWVNDNVLNVVGVGITLVIAFTVSRVTAYVVKRMETSKNKRAQTMTKVIASIIKYVVYIIAVIVVLSLFGVSVGPALAGLGIVGLIVGLGAQKLINDIISGFFIVFERHFDIGDVVEIDGFKGEIIDIGLKTTKIMNWKNEVKIVANGNIQTLVNYSKTPNIAAVEFEIDHKEDARKVIDILKAELENFKNIEENCISDVTIDGLMSLEKGSVGIRAKCLASIGNQAGVERNLRLRVKEILDENNISVPLFQVDVYQK